MLRILLVDDENTALKALKYLLEKYPEVEIGGMANDACTALEIIKTKNIQVVFLDIDMPELSGIEFVKQIEALNRNIAIVFVTAHSNFAVAAFELNAFDYILKPVSSDRLHKTIEKLKQSFFEMNVSNISIVEQTKEQFLNCIIAKKITDSNEILRQGKGLNIDLSRPFSLFFLMLLGQQQTIPGMLNVNVAEADVIIERLEEIAGIQVWKTQQGIGILDYTINVSEDRKKHELARAQELRAIAGDGLVNKSVVIGVATHLTGIEKFSERYMQACKAALIGVHVSPQLGIYHVEDNIFLVNLDQYIDSQSMEGLISSTIKKLQEHDQISGGSLFRTMEVIILSNNLQDVANTLFIHYKTVLFRKHTIEKILGFSLNSFTGRVILGMALIIYYLDAFSQTVNRR